MKKLISLLALVLIASCSNDDVVNTTTQNPADVYVAGTKNNQACYWKNNQLVALAQGSFTNSYTSKILVSNSDVHILGYTSDKSLYWKNGVLTDLTTTLSDASQVVKGITDIDVIGNDVYLVGFTKNPLIAAEIYDLAYWKNGVKTVVVQNINNIPQAFIAVTNDKVYITSQSNTADPVYYVNGVPHSLPSQTDIAGITKSNNAVYVYGSNLSTGFYKNLDTNVETNITTPYLLTNLVFDQSDIYYITADQFYKNSIAAPLNIEPINNDKNYQISFQKVVVVNGNIYSIQNCSPLLTPGFSMVGINSTNVFESNSTNGAGIFNDIFVVQN